MGKGIKLKSFANKRRLIIGDLHLTNNENDQYRWNFLNWVEEKIREYRIDYVYFLGDICEKKDRHPSILVNKVVESFDRLCSICNVVILKGNHDFDKEEDKPFFKFISKMNNIKFIVKPTISDCGKELFLPFSRDFHSSYDLGDIKKLFDYVYMHIDILGADIGNSLKSCEGTELAPFKKVTTYFISGHIHHAQMMGKNFEYIGSPYPIKFGDTYTGQIIFINENNEREYIKYDSIKKWSIRIDSIDKLADCRFNKGDQIKIEYLICNRDFHLWNDIKCDIKKYCDDKEVLLFSTELKSIKEFVKDTKSSEQIVVSPIATLKKFAIQENLSHQQVDIGMLLL